LAPGALGLVLLLFAGAALADVSATVALVSDYRFRGVSLTDNHPAVQAGATYDHRSGLFAGVFASNVDLYAGGAGIGGQLYGGYAWRWGTGLTSDVGVVRYFFAGAAGLGTYDYTEAFAGLTTENFSARLSLTPSYFGGAQGGYLDLSAAREIGTDWTFVAHAGALVTGSTTTFGARYSDARQLDFSLGVLRRVFDFSIGVSAVAVAAQRGPCANGNSRCDPGLVLVLQRSF
jgi:uncharacterized protein (TIGR02001 family)